MFELKTGVWCDFNDYEKAAFTKILELAEANVTQAGGTSEIRQVLMMSSELRRVFAIDREDWVEEELRAQFADRRRDSHVSRKIVRCAHDDCSEVQEATAVATAWRMARIQGWKLAWAETEPSIDMKTSVELVCPEHAKELGKTR